MRYFLARINPLIIREMRSRMRGRRAFIVLTIHTLLLSLLTGIIYATIYYDEISRSYAGYPVTVIPSAEFGPTLGKATFAGLFLLLIAIFSFVAPAFGAASIAGEKERQTYETLLITTMPARQLVLGKLGAILTLLVLFILVSLPIQGMAFFYGGVTPVEMILALVGLLVTIFAFTAVGLYISSLVRTTMAAVSLAYGFIIPVVYGIPFLIFLVTDGPLDEPFRNIPTDFLELLFNYALIFLMSINPFFASILTGEAAANGDGYFFYTAVRVGPVAYRSSLWMVSPWLTYVFFYTTLAGWLVLGAVRRAAKMSEM